MRSIITVTAAAACLFLAGCEGVVEPTDGSDPILGQQQLPVTETFERTEGIALVVDGVTYPVTEVVRTFTSYRELQSGLIISDEFVERHDEVNVRGQRVRCEGTPEQCVAAVRAAVRRMNSGEEM